MKQRVADIVKVGDRLFSGRTQFMSLCQELAMNFYPERADFTRAANLGEEYAGHLVSSAPVIARRDLAAQIQAMLRPRGKSWFGLVPEDEALMEDSEVLGFAQQLVKRQRHFMFAPQALLQRATKQADNDFITFGQGIITCEPDYETTSLLYRNWHLRDVAWMENARGVIDNIHRNWSPTIRQLRQEYGDGALHPSVLRGADKEPEKQIKCRHVVLPVADYDYNNDKKRIRGKHKFVMLCVDVENQHIIAEEPVEDHPYIIPRWQTVSGSQYAHSPAAHYALPDARTLQAISYTLLKAGEKAVDPPMIAVDEMIRSDIDIKPSGITWVDAEYDERLGDVLRPLSQDTRALRFGAEMQEKHLLMVQEAFFLNKINLPPMSADMTAYEVQIRTQEYIRNALPLFEPMETEYNAPLCEKSFNTLLRAGAFGSPRDWPDAVRGLSMRWTFESPLMEAQRKEETARFMESAQLLAAAAQIDPSLKGEWDYRKQFRAALRGAQAPLIPEEEANEARQAEGEAAQQQMAAMQAAQQGEAIQSMGMGAKAAGEGGQALIGMMEGAMGNGGQAEQQ